MGLPVCQPVSLTGMARGLDSIKVAFDCLVTDPTLRLYSYPVRGFVTIAPSNKP